MRRFSMLTAAVVAASVLAACGGGEPVDPGPLGVGRDVFGDMCSACHGDRGQGGTGPALDEVDLDFPACADQIEWIHLGSERWRETYGDTFGARARPVEGGMPSMEATFSDSEIAAVALYERTEFAGLPLEETAADCGVVLPGE
jgi:mono/diheme cytochrome c family protein